MLCFKIIQYLSNALEDCQYTLKGSRSMKDYIVKHYKIWASYLAAKPLEQNKNIDCKVKSKIGFAGHPGAQIYNEDPVD